jgi:hypothetical protein
MKSQATSPNPAGAVDAPVAFLFAFERQWRRAADQRRWVVASPDMGKVESALG